MDGIRIGSVHADLEGLAVVGHPLRLELEWVSVERRPDETADGHDISIGLAGEWWLDRDLIGTHECTLVLSGPADSSLDDLMSAVRNQFWPMWRMLAHVLHMHAGYPIVLPLGLPDEAAVELRTQLASGFDGEG